MSFLSVAPFTGAWIEIEALSLESLAEAARRTLHGCVD